MQHSYPQSLQNLINRLAKLPGVGPKSAQRLAFFLLKTKEEDALALAEAIEAARENVQPCTICGYFSDTPICRICSDSTRDVSLLCVVEEARDVVSLEKTRSFNGYYHVLGGAISPMEGIGPEKLNVPDLLKRLNKGEIKEVIMATNPNVEGEATSLYLARLIRPLGIKVTRIAHGVPVGGDLEYTDEATLSFAFLGRKEI